MPSSWGARHRGIHCGFADEKDADFLLCVYSLVCLTCAVRDTTRQTLLLPILPTPSGFGSGGDVISEQSNQRVARNGQDVADNQRRALNKGDAHWREIDVHY